MTEEIDRGDDVGEKLPPSTIDDSKDVEQKAVVNSDAVAQTDEEIEAEKLAEEKPRDDTGKFAKKVKEDNPVVPRERMNEAVTKERLAREAAEARAAALEAHARQQEESVEIKKMTEEIREMNRLQQKLLMDGEGEKAADLLDKIQEKIEQRAELKSDAKVARATTQAVEQVRMDSTIASLEATYAQFNPESEDFDQDLVDLVLAEQARLIRADSLSPSKALQVAGNKIMAKFQPANSDGVASKGLAAAKGADRKAEQVSKNLDTAKKQPGSMRSSGKDTDKGGEISSYPNGISRSDFDAMPESTKAKLRGDVL